jgi:hypothetical protein
MRGRELEQRLETIEDLLDKVERGVEKIELVTVVREPNTGISADAYNGLRKQVIAAASERTTHLNQLAQFDAALQGGATMAELEALVREWLGQASLLRVDDPTIEEAFEAIGRDDAPRRRVLRPGYVDTVTGRVVRAGLIERTAEETGTADEPAAEEATASDPATTSGGKQ